LRLLHDNFGSSVLNIDCSALVVSHTATGWLSCLVARNQPSAMFVFRAHSHTLFANRCFTFESLFESLLNHF
jgi:hypothetical protein